MAGQPPSLSLSLSELRSSRAAASIVHIPVAPKSATTYPLNHTPSASAGGVVVGGRPKDPIAGHS